MLLNDTRRRLYPPVPITLMAPDQLIRPLAVVQREAIESALILCEGNRQLAADRLGIIVMTLRKWTKKFREERAA